MASQTSGRLRRPRSTNARGHYPSLRCEPLDWLLRVWEEIKQINSLSHQGRAGGTRRLERGGEGVAAEVSECPA